jgi:hypothetical protein
MTEILKTQWSLMTERTSSRTPVLHKGMVYWGSQSGTTALFSTQVDVMLEYVQPMTTHTNTQANGVN